MSSRQYVAPALQNFGSVQAMTGILGDPVRADYVYNSSGDPISGNNDIGSVDLCQVGSGFEPCP